ncbi:putative flippase GtrA [Streptohalobacillus salinus]|uniref:Putative flippase GtrA n=1 Tax=Streptohalobacillus salinus TaxID=621096 RepID=A0A2V3WI24_9BACI|nr:GtrA family protein [Streptohalobacillus salinus]PXW92097.1 putative flippase GtrA [Streptohalobacillus salinus]
MDNIEKTSKIKTSHWWVQFKEKHPNSAQFLVFFLLSNGVTVLQIALMPILRNIFADTALIFTDFQIWQVGQSIDGSPYYVFDYAAGTLAEGGGGGLAYFLAVQISIAVAQIINFFLQRTITFKSNTNAWVAAFWYLVAYIIITIGAAAAQGFYKAPIYDLLMNTWELGSTGETIADVITMIINAAISFWVFYPIFKIIFKQVPEEEK